MKIVREVSTSVTRNHFDVSAFLMDDGSVYNFNDWNGEQWFEWWDDDNPDHCGTDARPIYRYEVENIDLDTIDENSDAWDHAIEMIGIDMC